MNISGCWRQRLVCWPPDSKGLEGEAIGLVWGAEVWRGQLGRRVGREVGAK